MRLSLCCDVLYLFKPAFELPAIVSLDSNKLDGNEAGVDLVLIQLFLLLLGIEISLLKAFVFSVRRLCA